MRKKHRLSTAERFDLLYQRAIKAWRIHKYVAAFLKRAHDQITPGAETRFRGETAEIDVLVDETREGIDSNPGVMSSDGAD
jgi:hypothetical protein